MPSPSSSLPSTPPSSELSSNITSQSSIPSQTIMSHHNFTAADLPIAGTKGAPKKFKGHAADVDQFLRHYERLLAKYNIVSDKDKVESITQYCSRDVREFLEGLSSYLNPQWNNFAKDIRKYYEADKETRRYKVRDLEKYVIESRGHDSFSKLESWLKYNRGFIRIAGWLLQKGKIDSDERAMYFWKGIPRRFRDRLELRLTNQKPDHDLSKPFPMADIIKAAEVLLRRDRFDKDRLPSDSEDSEPEDSDSETSSSSEDEKYTNRSKTSTKHKSKTKKKVHFKESLRAEDSSDSDDDKSVKRSATKMSKQKTGNQAVPDDEFEQLIKQLNSMSIKDPEYATVYFKAYRIDPIIRELVPTPNERRRSYD